MAYVKLTEELSKTIKNLRNDKNIKAVDLAKELNKSVAYVSKLENAKLVNIDFDTLINIFKFLIGDDKKFEDQINKTLEKVTIELSPEEIKEQEWMKIFDEEYRQIPIPDSLINFINDKLIHLNKTPEEIINEMNKNDDLSNKPDLNKYKKNSLIFNKDDSFVIFDLQTDLLKNILDHKIRTINYITMEGILWALCKLENFSSKEALQNADRTLKEHKFYTLPEKKEVLRNEGNKKALDYLLSEYDKENISLVNTLIKYIKLLSDWNIEYTNKKLVQLTANFKSNPSYTLAIISKDYNKLEKLKKEDKQKFLNELSELIKKFSEIEYSNTDNFKEY